MLPEYYQTLLRLPAPFRMINVMKNPKGYVLEEHSHPYFHINCVVDGSVTVETPENRFAVRVGEVFIMPPGVLHRLSSENGYRQIGFDLFDGAEDERGLFAAFSEVGRRPVTARVMPTVGFEHMRGLLESPTRPNRQRALHIVEGILLDLIDSLNAGNSPSAGNFSAFFASLGGEPWKLSLREIAFRLGLSRSALERLSQRNFGCGIGEYCQRLRFAKACRLLRTTELKMEEVAEELGFCDPSHFAVFFRSRAGCAPGKYRSAGEL